MRRPVIPQRARAAMSPAQVARSLERLSAQYRQAYGRGDFTQALECATAAWKLRPHPAPLSDVALCQMRLGHAQASYQTYLQVLKDLRTANVYDGMAEVCGQLGLADECASYGAQSLMLKIEQSEREPAAPTVTGWAQQVPPAFDGGHPERNAIAFSLFGADPRYCEMAVLNVQAARRLFPQWHCRFYVDDTVPLTLQQRLLGEGAKVFHAQALGIQDLPATTWRFMAVDDSTLDRVQFRDADSLVSRRDQAAVQAWCDSDRWFHLMRDYHTHTELILAGMWGACRGVFVSMQDAVRAYVSVAEFSDHFVDQQFLRHRVWKVARQSLLMHDERFGLPGSVAFPPHEPMEVDARYAHVGANVGAPTMEVQHAAPDGAVVHWELVDERGDVVCGYSATVQQQRYRANIPAPYAAQIGAGRWRVVTRAPT